MSDRMDEIRSTRAPTLREDQIELLRSYGQTKKTKVGDVLFRAGDTSNDFIVILEGEVEVIDDFAGEARTLGVFHASRFLGELNMLTGQAMYCSAMVRKDGKVLTIARERLKEVMAEEPNLSDIILKAFLARRAYMMRNGLGLRIVGSRHSGAATRLREFAVRNHLPHYWIELEEDLKAEALLEKFGAKPSDTPLTIWQGKDVLKNPTNSELARTIGLNVEAPWERTYDLVVVGAGPVGLGASVYGASAGQAALFLAGRTRRVYLLIRADDLGKSMSSYLVDRIMDAENVELLANTEVRELMGEDRLDEVVVEDNRSGARWTLGTRGLFFFIGAEANTGWLEGAVELDERGFVLTGRELDGSALEEDAWRGLSREPYPLETSLPGVFAAGDVRSGPIKRGASAGGEGSMTA